MRNTTIQSINVSLQIVAPVFCIVKDAFVFRPHFSCITNDLRLKMFRSVKAEVLIKEESCLFRFFYIFSSAFQSERLR